MSEETVLEREVATKPPTRWRNWWRVLVPHPECSDVGAEYGDMDVWPSREIAEQKARDEIAYDIENEGQVVEQWIGAFPEGSRP